MSKLKEIGLWALAIGCPPAYVIYINRRMKKAGFCPACGGSIKWVYVLVVKQENLL